MKDGFPIFDAHAHLGEALHSGRICTAEMLLRTMDGHGIERSLIIPFPVVEDFKRQHDIVGEAVRGHPDRFVGAACLSPFLPGAGYRKEVHRCAQEYGFQALKLQPQYHGLNPMNDGSDLVFETAIENKMSVVCHTGSGLPFSAPSLLMMPARKFPELKIVVGHCGGGIFVHEAIVAALFCTNILLELSTLMPQQVLEVLRHVPSDRLMIGSDFPENIATELGKILNLEVSDLDKRNILYQTCAGIFNA